MTVQKYHKSDGNGPKSGFSAVRCLSQIHFFRDFGDDFTPGISILGDFGVQRWRESWYLITLHLMKHFDRNCGTSHSGFGFMDLADGKSNISISIILKLRSLPSPDYLIICSWLKRNYCTFVLWCEPWAISRLSVTELWFKRKLTTHFIYFS